MNDPLKLLKIYTPSLYRCAIRSNKAQSAVIAKYEERQQTISNSLKEKGVFDAMACIYDLLLNATKNIPYSKEYLQFIDATVKQAMESVSESESPQLESLVIKMITSVGTERSEYKNHFAEIAVLSKLIASGFFKLVSIEKPLPNGKTIDFEISIEGKNHLLEVYNIDFDREKLKNSNDLIKFLEFRLQKKINDKLKGIDISTLRCLFVPVLWGDIVSLAEYTEAFDYFKPLKFISPFMIIGQYTHQIDGRVVFDFGSIDNFHDRIIRRARGDY